MFYNDKTGKSNFADDYLLSEYFGKRFKSKKLQKLAGFTTIVAVTAYMLSAIQGISTLMSSIAYLGFAVAFTLFMLCMYVFPYVEAL